MSRVVLHSVQPRPVDAPERRSRSRGGSHRATVGPVGRSGLVVLVPEVEVLVARHRAVHDRMAPLGVPAHVTALFPFRPTLEAAAAWAIESICASTPAFDL